MRTDDLGPGEMRISPVAIAGHRRYALRKADGTLETGSVVPSDHPCAEHSSGYLHASDPVRGDVRRVQQNIDYTAPGSRTRVATNAYRSGWDAVFGRSAGKVSRGSSGAN